MHKHGRAQIQGMRCKRSTGQENADMCATHTGAAGAQSPCGRWGTGSGGDCTAGLQRREVGKAGGRGEGARHCQTH